MRPIIHQPRNIVFGHFRQLFLKYAFQTGEDNQAFALIVVIDDPKLDLAVALFDNGGLFAPNISVGIGGEGGHFQIISPFLEME